MRHVIVALLVLAVVGQSTASSADSWSNLSTPAQVWYGTGSFFGSLLYTPAKGGFCLFGSIGGALTAIVSRPTASKVFNASCRGTWVINPEILQGHEKVQFVGEAPPARAAAR